MSPVFNNLIGMMDTLAIKTCGGIAFIFTPQDSSGPQTLDALICPPAMEEEFTPGSTSGTSVLRLFVALFTLISPQPQKGDAVSVNGVNYMVINVKADDVSGAVLKLRVT